MMDPIIKTKPALMTIEVAKLRKAPWNYKVAGTAEQLKKLQRSIHSTNSAGVLCVRELPKKGGQRFYEVIDGNHRLEAVLAAGWKTCNCENFGNITKAQAVIIARQRNYQWFADDEVELGKLYGGELLGEFDKEQLMVMLPDAIGEFDNLLAAGMGIGEGTQDPAPPPKSESIKLTGEQFLIVNEAITRCRETENDPQMSDGRCLELICGDYLAGN